MDYIFGLDQDQIANDSSKKNFVWSVKIQLNLKSCNDCSANHNQQKNWSSPSMDNVVPRKKSLVVNHKIKYHYCYLEFLDEGYCNIHHFLQTSFGVFQLQSSFNVKVHFRTQRRVIFLGGFWRKKKEATRGTLTEIINLAFFFKVNPIINVQ